MKKLAPLACAALGCLFLYVAALLFVYPGGWHPIVVPHTDLYMPLAIANSPFNWQSPRPIGYLLDYVRGGRGLGFAQSVMLLMIAANCAMVFFFLVKVVRAWGGASLAVLPLALGFWVYFWLIVTHPNFYIFGGWDAYAQFSFFLLSIAFFIQFFWWPDSPRRRDIVFTMLVALAFLSKETYALSACLAAALVDLLRYWRTSRRTGNHDERRTLGVIFALARVPVLITVAFVLAFVLNRALGSPFVANADGAYRISLNVPSIMNEWGRYATDGWSPVVISGFVLLGLVCVVDLIRGRRFFPIISLACFLAGVLAWLPNSLLPNHHFSQYSFSGAYLFFAPLVFLVSRIALVWNLSRVQALLMALTACVFVISPFFSGERYETNSYYLAQAMRQEVLQETISEILRRARDEKKEQKILVVGISSPFNPFDHPAAFLLNSPGPHVRLTVVAYGDDQKQSLRAGNEFSTIERVHVSKISSHDFDSLLTVGLDGRLLEIKGDANASTVARLGERFDLALYPEVARAFSTKKGLGYQALECATVLQDYNAFRESISCLAVSRVEIPENPYVYLYAARAFAGLGFKGAAIEMAQKSVALGGAQSPVFSSVLESMRNLAEPRAESSLVDMQELRSRFLE